MLISLIGETHAHTHTQCQSQRGASVGEEGQRGSWRGVGWGANPFLECCKLATFFSVPCSQQSIRFHSNRIVSISRCPSAQTKHSTPSPTHPKVTLSTRVHPSASLWEVLCTVLTRLRPEASLPARTRRWRRTVGQHETHRTGRVGTALVRKTYGAGLGLTPPAAEVGLQLLPEREHRYASLMIFLRMAWNLLAFSRRG